jgi:hypothetical protein
MLRKIKNDTWLYCKKIQTNFWFSIKFKTRGKIRIWIGIKMESRIRIGIKMMPIRNTEGILSAMGATHQLISPYLIFNYVFELNAIKNSRKFTSRNGWYASSGQDSRFLLSFSAE